MPEVAHTSLLRRAIRTLFHVLDETDALWIKVNKAWELNERHYGSLQGLDKQETVDKYGKDQVCYGDIMLFYAMILFILLFLTIDPFNYCQVLIWRRSYDIPPPIVDKTSPHHPSNDPRYAGHEFPEEFTESLATTLDRVLPYYESKVVPDLKDGKTVVIAAHGNSLRALVKHLDNIDEATIAELNIPTGTPLVYELDDNLNVIPSSQGMTPLRGRYLGDQEAIKARIEGVKNQTK